MGLQALEVFDADGDSQEAARLAADLQWLASLGVAVARRHPQRDAAAFTAAPAVAAAMAPGGCGLPVVLADGELLTGGRYPSREELAQRFGLPAKAAKSMFGMVAPVGERKYGCCG